MHPQDRKCNESFFLVFSIRDVNHSSHCQRYTHPNASYQWHPNLWTKGCSGSRNDEFIAVVMTSPPHGRCDDLIVEAVEVGIRMTRQEPPHFISVQVCSLVAAVFL